MNAWKSLKQGKFSQFGYWSAKAVQFRELLGKSHEPSPFADLVKLAKRKFAQKCVDCGHYPKSDGESHQVENFSWPEDGDPQMEDGHVEVAKAEASIIEKRVVRNAKEDRVNMIPTREEKKCLGEAPQLSMAYNGSRIKGEFPTQKEGLSEMTFEYEGKCKRCHLDCGTLDGKRMHTVSGLLFSKQTYKDGEVQCNSPVFYFESVEQEGTRIE